MPEATTPLTAAQFAAMLDAQVGKPYVLGYEVKLDDPDPDKFDCSELVQWGFARSGNSIPDLAATQYNATRAVKGEPAVGDLVFLRNNPARSNGIGHVAILTTKLANGDWRIVEARGRAYGVVRTTLSFWKTRPHFAGVRRLASFKLATAPVPVKPAKVTGVNVTTYNCQDPRFGGKADDDAAVLNRASSSVYLLTEAPEKVRTNIRIGLGGVEEVLVWERVSQAIPFRRSKWQHGLDEDVIRVPFGPTTYHGGLAAILTDKVTGQPVQFGVLHMPPSKVATELQRRKYFNKFVAELDPDLPTIIGGDFNSKAGGDWLRAAGFDVIATGATADDGRKLDYLACRNGGFHWIEPAELLDPGVKSDHFAVKGKARTAPTNTL